MESRNAFHSHQGDIPLAFELTPLLSPGLREATGFEGLTLLPYEVKSV